MLGRLVAVTERTGISRLQLIFEVFESEVSCGGVVVEWWLRGRKRERGGRERYTRGEAGQVKRSVVESQVAALWLLGTVK
jgi:hypothetical protein